MKTVIAEKVRARLADPASPPPLSGDPVGPRSIGCTVTRREAERIAEVFEGPTISARMRHVLFGVPVGAESTGQKVRVLSASDKGAGARETPEPELFPEPAPAEPEREAVDPEPDDGFDPLPDWPEGEADAGDRDLTEADVRKIERLAVLEFERRSLARRIADLEKSCAIAAVDMPGNMDIDAARGLSRAQLDVACANAERRTGRPVPGRRRRRREKALTVAAAIGLFALVVGYAAN